jgi:hypothetical protein
MKHSFKSYLAEAEVNAAVEKPKAPDASSPDANAMKIAAEFLDTTPEHLEIIDKGTEAKVLDTGREIAKKFIKMATGSWVIRQFKALGKMFARVEAPNGNARTYQSDVATE